MTEKNIETITTKQDYCYYFLFHILEMIRGHLCLIYDDSTLNKLFAQLVEYVDSKIEYDFEKEILDMSVVITQPKD